MEALYLYLLQRESAISLSAAEPKISVIDSADTDSTPVFPKKA
jgi:uncharacterized protein involved in exopolysaccharide biosynthesis